MKTIQCWRIEHAGDLVTRFSTKEAAEHACESKRRASASTERYAVVFEAIDIFDTVFEWNPILDKEAAQSGWNKLTPQERAALGLGYTWPGSPSVTAMELASLACRSQECVH